MAPYEPFDIRLFREYPGTLEDGGGEYELRVSVSVTTDKDVIIWYAEDVETGELVKLTTEEFDRAEQLAWDTWEAQL